MASEDGDNGDQLDAAHEPRECMPCRGSGQVISNLGGTQSLISCPWCGGGGVRVPGTDAQARWPREQTAEAGSGEHPAEADGADGPAAPPATA
jgi:DnaJ-class molecular chaperone